MIEEFGDPSEGEDHRQHQSGDKHDNLHVDSPKVRGYGVRQLVNMARPKWAQQDFLMSEAKISRWGARLLYLLS
jgi:hypothetical protein